MRNALRIAVGFGVFAVLSTSALAQTQVSQHLLLVDPTTGHMIKLEVPALTGPFTVTMPSSAGTLMTTTSGWAVGGNNLGSPGPIGDQVVGTISNHNLAVVAGNDQKMLFSSTVSDPITILDGTGLAFQDADETNVSSFTAGNQSADIRYTLPTTQPAANNILTASSVSGSGPYDVTLSWAPPATYKEMTANETNSSNTTYEQLGELDIAVEANTTYILDAYLFGVMSVNQDLDIRFTFPSGTLTVGANVGNRGPAAYNSGSPVTLVGLNTVNEAGIVKIHGLVKIGGTGGTLSTSFKVNSGSATYTVYAGSHIILRKL